MPQTKKRNRAFVQYKLAIGQPGDKYEKEADSVADRVMKMNDTNAIQTQTVEEEETAQAKMQMQPFEEEEEKVQPKIQMQPIEEEEESVQPKIQMQSVDEEEESIQMQPNEEEEESLQMKSAIQKSPDGNQYASNDISQKLNSTKGSGEKLPNKVEAEMGRKIGADFSATKIHTDSHAVQMNRKLGAQAFTHGRDIYFNQGKYDPGSSKGKHLLAHELTHTIQQGKSIVKTKKGKLKQSSNDYIQRFPLNTTNINKLREHLSNDNESEAITLMGNLTADEKNAVLNSREFKELAISSFGDDEMYRAMKALRHNLYKSLEWMFDEGTNWEAVANLIRLVPDKKDVVRTDNWMKKQFVSICDNKTMAEAVDLLGGTLLEKLLWMHAEGSSWELIKEKLTNPAHINQKTTLYGSSVMLDFFISNRNDKEMAEAVDLLGGTLLQKLTWMKAEGSNWKLMKEKIAAPIDATQKTALYSIANMRDFFVSKCNDKEMAEVVDLLGGTLLQKLNWMKAEGSNWSLVREKIRNTADVGQKTAIYGSPGMKEFFVDICNNKTIVEAVNELGFIPSAKLDWILAEGGRYTRNVSFMKIKRKYISLKGEDKYGHWWLEMGGESYGWWPKYKVGLGGTLFGTEGELNGQTTFGGSPTTDPHHGDPAEKEFKPILVNKIKTDSKIKTEVRTFSNAYSGEWRWTFGWGQNCRTFQSALMKKIGLEES